MKAPSSYQSLHVAFLSLAFTAVVTLLSGCGGGGDGGTNEGITSGNSTNSSGAAGTNGNLTDSTGNSISPSQRKTLSGTVAIGGPLQDVDVAIYSMDGRRIIGSRTDESGRYSVDVTDYAAPYLVLVATNKSNNRG